MEGETSGAGVTPQSFAQQGAHSQSPGDAEWSRKGRKGTERCPVPLPTSRAQALWADVSVWRYTHTPPTPPTAKAGMVPRFRWSIWEPT